MFRDFNRVRTETATRVWSYKKVDRTKIQLKGNRPVGWFWLVVEDIRKGGEAWQEIKNKNIGRWKRLSTAVRIKRKCWRRICGIDGGLSKL